MNASSDLQSEAGPERPAAVTHGHVLTNFLVNIAASWIASPLGVLFLHYVGYGSDHYLVALLLSMSAVAPFQLLCNEYLATSAVRSNAKPTIMHLIVVLGAQMIVTFIVGSVFGDSTVRLNLIYTMVISVLLAISTWLSYNIAVCYYGVTLRGDARYRHSVVVGAIPGMVTLAIYLVAGLSRFTQLILLAGLAPAVVQWLYVRSLSGPSAGGAGSRRPPWAVLIGATLLLGLAAGANALVRGEIGFLDQRFIALILTGLNLVGTMVMMVSRAGYLVGARDKSVLLFIMAIGLCIAAVIILPFFHASALLVAFLGLQMMVAAMIAHIRRIGAVRELDIVPSDRLPH